MKMHKLELNLLWVPPSRIRPAFGCQPALKSRLVSIAVNMEWREEIGEIFKDLATLITKQICNKVITWRIPSGKRLGMSKARLHMRGKRADILPEFSSTIADCKKSK